MQSVERIVAHGALDGDALELVGVPRLIAGIAHVDRRRHHDLPYRLPSLAHSAASLMLSSPSSRSCSSRSRASGGYSEGRLTQSTLWGLGRSMPDCASSAVHSRKALLSIGTLTSDRAPASIVAMRAGSIFQPMFFRARLAWS